MCKRVLAAGLFLVFMHAFCASAVQYAYQVSFTDKNPTIYSLSTPLAYLSSRSVARRTTLGIAVDSTDLPVCQLYIDSVLTLSGGKIHETSRWFNYCIILVSDTSQMHNLDGKAFIKGRRIVGEYAGILHAPHPVPPAQAFAPALLHKTTAADATFYGVTWTQTSLVNGNHLYANGYTGEGKLIAVLDAGFLGTDVHAGFDSMYAGGRLIDKHNFTLDTSYVYDYDTHGFKVLSTMAGYLPGTYVGSAPLASYALYVTEDNNSEQVIELRNMVSAMERADSIGADVITTSLGYNTFDNPADNFVFVNLDGKTTIVAQASNIATTKGMLVVATAGNEGGNSWNRILTPGDADSALTIGSVTGSGINASNSGFGPNAAGQIKPDVCAMGEPANIFSGTGFGTENGTSFSTPQVAGWAASLWQANPTATPYQLRMAIIRCASRYSTPGDQIGYGIPDFNCTNQFLGIIDVNHPFNASDWVVALPNPFHDALSINVIPDTDQTISIRLVDIAGRTITQTSGLFRKGLNPPVVLQFPGLPSGLYLLQAVSPTRTHVSRVVKW